MRNPVFRNGHKILTEYEKMNPFNCPVDEQTADGVYVGACEFYLKDGTTCPRHGIVKDKKEFGTPYSTLEARLIAKEQLKDQYHKDMVLWLCDCFDNMYKKIVPLKASENAPQPPPPPPPRVIIEGVGIVKPPPPPERLIRESDGLSKDLCPKCGSSFKIGMFGFRTKHCIQPKCENYYGAKK